MIALWLHGLNSRAGVVLAPIVVLLDAGDSSIPAARLELGTAAGSFARCPRLAPNSGVVPAAEFEVQCLTGFPKPVGAGS